MRLCVSQFLHWALLRRLLRLQLRKLLSVAAKSGDGFVRRSLASGTARCKLGASLQLFASLHANLTLQAPLFNITQIARQSLAQRPTLHR